MAYNRRRAKRNSKDVLGFTLKNLNIGQELVCTHGGYLRIQERVDAFRKNRRDVTIAIIASGNVRTIRRIA